MERIGKSKTYLGIKDKNKKQNNLENLMVVCVPCHKRADGWGKVTDYAKEHNISISYAWDKLNPEKARIKNLENSRKHYKKYRKIILQKAREKYRNQIVSKSPSIRYGDVR